MKLQSMLFTAAIAAAFVGNAPAWAQSQGGVVRGNTNINVNANDVNTIAVGSGNTAKTNIGSVKGGSKGNTNVTVDVKHVSNIVGGHGRKGCVNIGTKGADPDCK
jgi:hypothetical protein